MHCSVIILSIGAIKVNNMTGSASFVVGDAVTDHSDVLSCPRKY
jgi:hypothetical protein